MRNFTFFFKERGKRKQKHSKHNKTQIVILIHEIHNSPFLRILKKRGKKKNYIQALNQCWFWNKMHFNIEQYLQWFESNGYMNIINGKLYIWQGCEMLIIMRVGGEKKTSNGQKIPTSIALNFSSFDWTINIISVNWVFKG